ncbi:uncharacterized protein isoform X1 [Choristoneura fumiferana]|uniref:uncharacterized protein isoform X1 n=1 Tax=Choristoneura fumiferana TaxID=7141 RepID=UPI003D15C4FF
MEGRYGLDTSEYSTGLEEMYSDFDQWICKFNARLTSRLSTDSTCTEAVSTIKQHKSSTRTQQIIAQDGTENIPRSEVTVPLQEIFVNGLLVLHKIRKDPFTKMTNFLNMFKTSDDFTSYDYVLWTLVGENGRKSFHKYIRSKI